MLEPEILLGFVEEAQSYTPTIQQGILDFHQNPARIEEIQRAYRQVHTIKGAALMIGMSELSVLAETMETRLETLLDGEAFLNADSATFLLAHLERIEDLLAAARTDLLAETVAQPKDFAVDFAPDLPFEIPAEFAADLPADFTLDFNADFDADLSAVENEPETIAAPPGVAENVDDAEEVDSEMLEVFALEAEEHLQSISQNLQTLEQNPQDREALQNIRRSAHTLKGAAGVVGFVTTMNLAHRMEDLLDHLADHPRSSDQETTVLLLAAIDALEKLSRGANSPEFTSEIETLYNRFDDILQKAELATAARHQDNNDSIDWRDDATTNRRAADFANQNVARSAETDNQTAAHSAPKTVVRVGLDNLDNMAKLMGEIIVNRTNLEQRLKDIERQLQEMRLSTGRLRNIAGKLEVDYEASRLQHSSLGMRIFDDSRFAATETNHFGNFSAYQNPQFAARDSQSNGFDELEFDRYTEFHQLTRQLVETSSDAAATTGALDDLLIDLDQIASRERRLSDELQERMMRLRMVAFGTLATRLYRTVRVTADAEDKLVDLEIAGEDCEIDTQVLNSLVEPLLHLLRNAVVHGIEPADERGAAGKPARGAIRLRAFHEGTNIVLAVSDDGRGMNAAKLREKAAREFFVAPDEAAKMSDETALQLVFLPGFSTAARINENAGRGVGMDIVRESIERQHGSITIQSEPGKGTTMLIRLPMSLHVTRALLVRAGVERFAIPLTAISAFAQTNAADFTIESGETVVTINNQNHAARSLNSLLDLPETPERTGDGAIQTLLVRTNEKNIALTLDEAIEAREIVIKPLAGLLKNLRGLLGASVLGDGSVIPVLDVASLVAPRAGKLFAAVKSTRAEPAPQPIRAREARPRDAQLSILIVDDSPSVRRVMTTLIEKTGWLATTAKDGLEALELLQAARRLPDIVLSDVEMPRMDGYELLATLKQQESLEPIPVVMITSRAGEKHRRRALNLGASDYIVKPYQDNVLLDTIRQLTGEPPL